MSREKLSVGQKIIKLADALGWKEAETARRLGVSRQTVNSYNGHVRIVNPRPFIVDRMIEATLEIHPADESAIRSWLHDGKNTEPPLAPSAPESNIYTNVYHNDDQVNDSGLDHDLLFAAKAYANPRTIPVSVLVGQGSSIWSAKGAKKESMRVYSFIVDVDRVFVLTEGDTLGTRNRQVVFGFKKDEFPHGGRLLLCHSKTNPDLHTVRYIDPLGAYDVLLSPSPEHAPENLSDWEIVGFADVALRRSPTGEPEADIRPSGIAPGVNRL